MKFLETRCSEPTCWLNTNAGMAVSVGQAEPDGMRADLERQADSHAMGTGHQVEIVTVFRTWSSQ